MITFAVLVAVLYFAREILIPVALGGLLCFLLSPVAERFQKWRLGRIPGALLAVLLGCAFIVTIGLLLAGQLVQFVDQLPQYQSDLHQKLQALHASPDGSYARFTQTIDDLGQELESLTPGPPPAGAASQPDDPVSTPPLTSQPSATSAATAPAQTQPIQVTLAQPRVTGVGILRNLLLRTMSPLVTLGVVLVLTLFMLIQRADLRDRAIRLMGDGQLHVTTRAVDDAFGRVSRYLLMQLLVNCTFGLCIWLGLYAIGIPFSPLWGLLAGLLRFLPYFGVPAASLPVLIMALVSHPGFGGVILVVILFVGLETALSYFVEPWLYGSKTGISPLAILVSALFWAWLWGPSGLMLSTPLTVCLAVAGRHVPRLRFLYTLLSDEPALPPAVRLYQRLLAQDTDDAWEMIAGKFADSSLAVIYDQLLLPAVITAEQSRLQNELDESRAHTLLHAVGSLVEDLEELANQACRKDATRPPDQQLNGQSGVEPAQGASRAVLCAGVSSQADDLGARMLAGILRQAGLEVHQASAHLLAAEFVQTTLERRPQIICLSATTPSSQA